MALADSLKLAKASHIGKKPPHSKIKYSEVILHKIFPHSKKVLVLGVHAMGSPQQYLVLTFEQPLKATRLDDELAYADDAPKHNLKNRIPVFEESSPVYVVTNSPSSVNATGETLQYPLKSLSEFAEGSRETTPINENDLLLAKLNSPAGKLEDLSNSRVVGLPRQPAHSPSLSPSPPTSPMVTQSNSHTPQSISHNHIQPETLNEPANPEELNSPICAKCQSECKDLVSTATSPVKMPANKSRSRSSSSSHSHTHSDSCPQSLCLTCSHDKSQHSGRSDIRTSTASRRSMTTDASSHYVVYGERPLYEHYNSSQQQQQQQKRKPSLVNNTTLFMKGKSPTRKAKPRSRSLSASSSSSSSSSASSFSSSSERQPRSRRGHQPRSLDPSSRVHRHKFIDAPKTTPNTSKPLFILATGRFQPFSELSHEHDNKTRGVCSICGEVGVGDPRQVEIIRTDSSGGPVISDDGTVYMYSTTRPAEYTNDDEPHRKNKSHHSGRKHRHSRNSRSSSSSSGICRNGIEQPVVAPISLKRHTAPTSASLTEVYVPNESRQRSNHKYSSQKIYRLDSSDSDSSSSSSVENEMSHLGSIKVVPLRY